MKHSSAIRALAFLAFGIAVSTSAFAQSHVAGSSRETSLDFEDQVVEGMNKRPFDYLNTLANKDRKRDQSRLYEKRTHFRPELADSLDEVRFRK